MIEFISGLIIGALVGWFGCIVCLAQAFHKSRNKPTVNQAEQIGENHG